MHSSHLKTLFTAAALAATFFAPTGESHAAESQPAVAVAPDYAQWVGRTLVRNGSSDPSDVPADRLVHERDVPKPYRIITPDSFVTQEYRPDRLNLYVDDRNTITRVNFG